MKRLTKIFFFFTFLIVNCTLIIDNSYAQWIAQNSGTNQNLYDVEFINENTGWAVGDAGVIIKTTDGGKNWFNVPNPTTQFSPVPILWNIFPVDSNYVYVAGGRDLIMKSTNGGLKWEILNISTPSMGTAFNDVFFLNKDTGWFLGTMTVFRTYDGGQTLDSFSAPWVGNWAIYFKDINTGIFTGDGAVMKTTNGGETWFGTSLPPIAFYMFRKLAVVGDNVWVIGGVNPPVLRSTDFCETWEVIDTILTAPGGIIGVNFANELTGWVGGHYGRIYKTTDGGFNWRLQVTPEGDLSFRASIYSLNDTVVYAVVGAGRIIYTETGGEEPMLITQIGEEIPSEYNLYQNYPNPFNPTTNIQFGLPRYEFVTIKIYDMSGRELEILFNEFRTAGRYIVGFNASHLASGVYFYTIKAGSFEQTRRMILLK